MSAKIYVANSQDIIPLERHQMSSEIFAKIITGESHERGVLPFDVMEARDTVCFKLDEHLVRFTNILNQCRIIIPMNSDKLAHYVWEALLDANFPEAKVRIDVVMGEERSREALAVIIKVSPFLRSKPLTLVTAKYIRFLPNMKLAGDYVFSQIIKRRYRSVDDVLYIDPRTMAITEASRANFFAVKYLGAKSRVYGLRSSNILNGITRQTLKDTLKDAKNRDFAASIEEAGMLNLGELAAMDEVFMTSSGIRVAPVVRINDLTWEIGKDGLGGPVTRELSAAFNNYLDAYYKLHLVD